MMRAPLTSRLITQPPPNMTEISVQRTLFMAALSDPGVHFARGHLLARLLRWNPFQIFLKAIR